MLWQPSKLGVIVTLFGAFFAACEVYGTYGYFMQQQGGLDYVVFLGCGIAAAVPFLPPFADAARRRGWSGLAWSMWLALPLALIVVMAAALQRTGSATDEAEKDRAKASAALTLASQNKTDAEAEIAKLGTVRALADIETDIARVKLQPRYSSSGQCADATAKASRDLCTELAKLEGEKTKAVEMAKQRKTLGEARVKIAAGSGGTRDSLAFRISGYTGGAISEDQVRLWQPLFIPILASWLAGALLTFGMRMDLNFDEAEPPAHTQRAPSKPVVSAVASTVRQPDTTPPPARPASNVVKMVPKSSRPKIDANVLVAYMAAHVPEADGEMADCGEMMKGFRVWCAQQDPPIEPMDAESFGLALMAICKKADIRIMNKNGRAYCVGRKVVA